MDNKQLDTSTCKSVNTQKIYLNKLRHCLGSLFLLILSITFVWGGLAMGVGSPFRLGTGAFPFITGLILAILSIILIFQDINSQGLQENPDWVSFLAICVSLITFSLCVSSLGLIPAAFLTIVVASLPDKSLSFKGKLSLGIIVALSSWVLFIIALDLPFKAIIGI